MASPNSMTREELLEYAALDAFGLLDEYEASLYTRSFHHAPIAVQNELLQRQADIVNDPSFQSIESPDPNLRDRVLEAVSEAIEQEASQLVPLATIGRNRGMATAETGSRAYFGAGQYWRAAAFALCAGLIVVAYFLTVSWNWGNQVAMIALQNNTDTQLEQMIGPEIKHYLFDPATERVFFTAANPSGPRATLFIDAAGGTGFLVTEKLTASQQPVYTLSTKDASGNIQAVHRFSNNNGRLSGSRFQLDKFATQVKNVAWQITDQTGTVLMASI